MAVESATSAPARNGGAWLTAYIALNLMTTVLNKFIMKTFDFPYPIALSLWHYTCSSIGSLTLLHGCKYIPTAKLDREAHIKLFLFSVLFNINILISVLSLNMVSMALHQIIRALVPAFTVIICYFMLGKTYPKEILASLAVIFIGVSVYAGKGEVSYTMQGLMVTALGGFLAALKGVMTNIFM